MESDSLENQKERRKSKTLPISSLALCSFGFQRSIFQKMCIHPYVLFAYVMVPLGAIGHFYLYLGALSNAQIWPRLDSNLSLFVFCLLGKYFDILPYQC